jgi:hypothetical protein
MGSRVLLALACLAAAGPARAGDLHLGLEATFGAQQLGPSRIPGSDRTLSGMGDFGGTALVFTGPFAVGAAVQGRFGSDDHALDASALAGFTLHLLPPLLRVELLGETGLTRLRQLDVDPGAPSTVAWYRFYGFRPGISLKLPALPFRVGLWGLVRWHPASGATGPAYGLLGRIGFDF